MQNKPVLYNCVVTNPNKVPETPSERSPVVLNIVRLGTPNYENK